MWYLHGSKDFYAIPKQVRTLQLQIKQKMKGIDDVNQRIFFLKIVSVDRELEPF